MDCLRAEQSLDELEDSKKLHPERTIAEPQRIPNAKE
jgi:hypothetical protein